MEKILSIIIPTYNMEMYLSRCIDSLLKEESIIQYLEIIIVNDGSTDNSLKIAESYKNLYPQSINIIDKPNGNYGSCINAALKIATGKYFRILDSDDWYDNNALTILMDKLHSITVDMIFTAYQTINSNQEIIKHYSIDPLIPKDIILPINSAHIKKLQPYTDLTMHAIAYRTQLLREIDYSQLEGISYTDTEYVFYPLAHVKNIIFFDITLYQYFVGRDGQTVSISSRIQHAEDMFRIVNRMLENPLSKEQNNTYYLQCGYMTHAIATYYHIILVLQKLTKSNKMRLIEFDKKVKRYDSNLYKLLNKVKCMGIPYIYFWRTFHLSIIPSNIYKLLKGEK